MVRRGRRVEPINAALTIGAILGILYFLHLGTRHGCYNALIVFLTVGVSFGVTISLYEQGAMLVGRLMPQMRTGSRIALSYWTIQVLGFFGMCYFTFVALSPTLVLQKHLDKAGGLVFGALNGVTITGVVFMLWFVLPFSEKMAPTQPERLIVRPHEMLLSGYGRLVASMPGARSYHGPRVFNELRLGRPKPPSESSGGIWVFSIPMGGRVFYSPSEKHTVDTFRNDLTGWTAQTEPTQRKKLKQGYVGQTPFFLASGEGVAWIAVEKVLRRGEDSKSVVSDGELGRYEAISPAGPSVCKLYRRERKESGPITLIALFPMEGDLPEDIERELPTVQCFPFDLSKFTGEIISRGASAEEADQLSAWFGAGGKVLFGKAGNRHAVEWLPGGQWEFTRLTE